MSDKYRTLSISIGLKVTVEDELDNPDHPLPNRG